MKKLRRNSKPFSEICHNSFGREVIYTNEDRITESNIVKELGKSLSSHRQNQEEIDYLYDYYKGNQPVLYREKLVRPEINNKVVQNTAYFIVETKAADIASEPIQYVLRGTDERKSDEIAYLNTLMDAEDKGYSDIALARWRSICGTSYRVIENDEGKSSILDETDFRITVADPRQTYVVYYNSGVPAYSVQMYKNPDNKQVYFVYTPSQWFEIISNKIVRSGVNGFLAIPVIEYPNNENRLSDIEITISLSDALNEITSDRQDGVQQFVQSFIKFVNCEMDAEKFSQLRQSGAFVVKSNNGENKADVDIMSSELNQSQSQVVVDDLFNKILVIQGIANREGNTGGDTQGAVNLRNGWVDSERRAELSEPIFKQAEKQFLRILLYMLTVRKQTTLKISDIEIKISRSKMDNMLTKAETLKMLLESGIYPERAVKSVGFFADPEQVAIESKKRFDILYPQEQPNVDETVEVIDEVG
jgi:SPP1 family phage portal protein